MSIVKSFSKNIQLITKFYLYKADEFLSIIKRKTINQQATTNKQQKKNATWGKLSIITQKENSVVENLKNLQQ